MEKGIKREILHFDMDAFFANVEIRDNPELEGKPVIIGSKPGTRGVVSTCSYEARKYGVHSAMSTTKAFKLCPNGIFILPNMYKYKKVSDEIKKIVSNYSDTIEFLSLDEGFLDLTHTKQLFGGSKKIMNLIKDRIYKETNLSCSVGLGYNKMTAKLASEENKPNGMYIIKNEEQFKKEFGLKKIKIIPGIGKVTYDMLKSKNLFIIRDLWKYSLNEMKDKIGNVGIGLYYKSRGIDNSIVGRIIKNKSRGKEITYQEDIYDKKIIYNTLKEIIKEISFEMKNTKKWCKTITVKIKYEDMEQITRSKTVESSIRETLELYEVVDGILKKISFPKKVRLAGMYVSNFTNHKIEQLKLGERVKKENIKKVSELAYKIKKKYGKNIIIDPLDCK